MQCFYNMYVCNIESENDVLFLLISLFTKYNVFWFLY